jgi:transposase
VRVVKLPWAEPSSRFTALFESLAIAWLKAASQKAVAEQLALSWDEIHGILERAVKRGLARRQAEPIRHLGVDEKAYRKGHKYMTVVNDLVRGRVLSVAEDRKQESLDGFWGTLTEAQREGRICCGSCSRPDGSLPARCGGGSFRTRRRARRAGACGSWQRPATS